MQMNALLSLFVLLTAPLLASAGESRNERRVALSLDTPPSATTGASRRVHLPSSGSRSALWQLRPLRS